MPRRICLLVLCLTASGGLALADDPKPQSVLEILSAHDKSLMRDLDAYIQANPNAEDIEQAYMTLFERAIENDWFVETKPAADRYLARSPEGAVAPLAQIVGTMAYARQGKFEEALALYRKLLHGLNEPEQEEFATHFADSLVERRLDGRRV